ncbi:MAG: hypothetical protein N3A54_07055, partial [Patescibacteria group bacterium]|nr:hypothetical protein [Patescibacteria group bacterium]
GLSWADVKNIIKETVIRKEKERGNDLYHLARRAMVKHKLRFGYTIDDNMRRTIEEFKQNYPDEYEELVDDVDLERRWLKKEEEEGRSFDRP